MVWEPFALAVVMGLLVSAAIYFVVMWPSVEPPDDAPEVTPSVADAPAVADAGRAGHPADAALTSDK